MRNLIKAEFFNLSKSFGYRAMMALSVGVGLLFGICEITGQTRLPGYQALPLMTSAVMYHTIFTIAFTAVFFCSKFSDRTMGTNLFCGLQGRSIFLSKLVVYFTGLLCLLSAFVVVPTVIASIVNGFGKELRPEVCMEVLAQVIFFWLIALSLGGFFIFLALATKNKATAIGAGLGILFILLAMTCNYVNSGWEQWSLAKYSFVCQMYVLGDWEHLQKGLFLGVSLVTLISTLIAATLIFEKTYREEERYRLLQQRSEMMEYDYRAMTKAYQEKEILLHDVRKHMLAIQEMAEAGRGREIVRYLEEMDGVLQKGRNRDLANHDLLNLILNRKFQEAEESGISVCYELDDMGSLILKSIEICALFSNILDNAIEANRALAEETGQWIRLACTRNGQMLVISVSNPVSEGKIRFVGGIPQTTKKDNRNHGLGMLSIQHVVDSYGGHMQIEVRDDIFRLEIYLEGFH